MERPGWRFRLTHPTEGRPSHVFLHDAAPVCAATDEEASALAEKLGRELVISSGVAYAYSGGRPSAEQVSVKDREHAGSMILGAKAWIEVPTPDLPCRFLSFHAECTGTPEWVRLAKGVIPASTRVAVVTRIRDVPPIGEFDLAQDGTIWITKSGRIEHFKGPAFCGHPQHLSELRITSGPILVEVDRGRWGLEELA